jgi:hypothetical protein
VGSIFLDSANEGCKDFGEKAIEVVLYHLISESRLLSERYEKGGMRDTARQYGCEVVFREAHFQNHPGHCFFRTRENDISDDGSCISAVLISDDREKLLKARQDIYMTFGRSKFTEGRIRVSA